MHGWQNNKTPSVHCIMHDHNVQWESIHIAQILVTLLFSYSLVFSSRNLSENAIFFSFESIYMTWQPFMYQKRTVSFRFAQGTRVSCCILLSFSTWSQESWARFISIRIRFHQFSVDLFLLFFYFFVRTVD